jgi:hypothetical protein
VRKFLPLLSGLLSGNLQVQNHKYNGQNVSYNRIWIFSLVKRLVVYSGGLVFILVFAITADALEIAGDRTVTGPPSANVTVSITLSGTSTHSSLVVESLDLNVQYDTSALEFLSASPGAAFTGGPFTPQSLANDVNGLVLTSTTLVQGFNISDGQEVLQLHFRIRDTASAGATAIDIVEANVNEDAFEQLLPGPDSTDGIITIGSFADGDVNIDGQVNLTDLLLMQLTVLKDLQLTPEQFQHADIAPQLAGVPVPDGVIDIRDVLALQRQLLDF